MPIDPNAIFHFLERKTPKLPDVKSMHPENLEQYIYDTIGFAPYFVTEPRPHQLAGLALALDIERILLFYFMRMGKTKTALDWAQHLALSGKWEGKGIIVVPRPILTDVWEFEATRHSELRVQAVGPSMDDMLKALDEDADLIVIAWTSLQAMLTIKRPLKQGKNKGKMILEPDYEKLDALANCFSLMIVDEIHACKNHQSLRFAIGAGLFKHCRYRMGLTGSAWGRNPLDVWAQAFLIDGGKTLHHNYYFFEAAFGKQEINRATGRKEFKFDMEKLPLLQDKLSNISLFYKREEATALQESVIELAMHGDQLESYEDVINQLITTPSGDRQAISNVFVRLRQASSGYLPFQDEEAEQRIIHFERNSKLEWLRDFLEELEPDIKVVIFYEFTASGRMICAALAAAKITHSWLWSGTKNKAAAINSFKSREAQVIVVNSASGDVGIDLSVADYQLFYESPLSIITRVQAEQRAQGAARQGRALLIDDLVCSPVERRIRDLVKEGKDTMAELYRDPAEFAKMLTVRRK